MSSISRFLKQIPSDTQYFIPLNTSNRVNLLLFNADANASTTSYVSGAAAGNFTASNIPAGTVFYDASGTITLFRDMGKTIVSSGRTFRRVQLLRLDAATASINTGGGQSGWTSSNLGTPGVWQAGNEGVAGSPSASTLIDSDFNNFYFETGARGLGVAQGLIRYG
jgi:hypothetical protein